MLLGFASYSNLKAANSFGPRKPSRWWTRYNPRGDYHNQIDFIMIKQSFQSSVNNAKTRSFPGADIGSNHELVMMTLRVSLQRTKIHGNIKIRFSLEKLKDPNIAECFWATIGETFAPLLALENQDTEIDALINSFNIAMTETANNTLSKHRPTKKPWVTDNIFKLCNKRKELKQKKNTTAKLHKEPNQPVKKGTRKAKETWIEKQCQSIEENLQKNNSKKAYQLAKELTSSKQGRATTIQDEALKCLAEEQDILKSWTEDCSELYTHTTGEPKVLEVPPPISNGSYPILREEVEAAVRSLKEGKSAGVDNIPLELIQAGGEAMIDLLLIICNKIWQAGKWSTPWTQSLITTLQKKGNLRGYDCAKTTVPSAWSIIQVRSCYETFWTDWSHKLRISSKNGQASEQ